MASTRENLRTLAQRIADFTFGLSYDAVPDEVMAAARRHLADSLACAVGARNTVAARALREYAVRKGGRSDATILGADAKVPAELAALVNGTMVRYLDANDIFVWSRGGPSGHCSDGTAGLLAFTEQYRRSGAELLTCLVASYELQGALAESFTFWDRGLHVLTNVGWLIPIVAARLAGATPVEARARLRSLRCNRHGSEYMAQTYTYDSDDQGRGGGVGSRARIGICRVGYTWRNSQ
jgi:2-methylcitrate dehydratase